MPPVSKQQKTSKAGWTRKRHSPSVGAQYPSPAKAAAAAKRIADVRREATTVAEQNNHNLEQDIRANPNSSLAARVPHNEQVSIGQRSHAPGPAVVVPKVIEQPKTYAAAVQPAAAERPKASAPAQWTFPTRKILEENPYQVTDYQIEIVHYMVEMDNCTLANVESMDSQPEVQWFMRPFLLDFLVEVHAQFRLRPETLYLALNLVDRYVSKRVVYKKHYQLVGCAALWTAAKFEDQKDRVPLVKELSEMCCKAYDESAFIQMEGHVLSTVNWNIGAPSAEAWLRLFNKEAHEEQRTQDIARFIMEMTLYFRDFVGLQAYDIATGAMILARFIAGKQRRTDLLQGRRNIFGSESCGRVIRIVKLLDMFFSDYENNVSDVLYRKYMVLPYSQASVVVKLWYEAGNRYLPSLGPYDSVYTLPIELSDRRFSEMSSSPSGGQSSSSSENGDEPLTPNTPVHMHNIDPFSAAAKENVAPTPTRVKAGAVPTSIGAPPPQPSQKVANMTDGMTKFYDLSGQAKRAPQPFERRLSN